MKLLKEESFDSKVLIEESKEGQPKKYYIEGVFIQAEIKNRNGRIYQHKLLKPEVDRYIKEMVDKNRAVGELGHPSCFHEKTQLLTVNDGWKYIKDVKIGEEIYTLNDSIKEVEIQKVESVYNQHYYGKMYEFKSRTFSTTTTPNHRFLLKNRENDYTYITAEYIFSNFNKMRKYSIPKTHKTNFNSPKEIDISGRIFDFDTFISFMGLYLSEGSVTHRKGRNNSYIVQISQNVGTVANRLYDIFNKMDINYRVDSKFNGIGNEHLSFRTCNNLLSTYLLKFGKAKDKFLDRELLNKLDSRTAKIFLEHYIMGDGRGELNTKFNRCDVFSISKRMIEDISQIAFIAGLSTRTFSMDPQDSSIGDRIIHKENKQKLHFCRFLTTEGIYLDDRFMKIKEINHNDNVYCVSVKNGNFFARDDGYTFWTGNSPTINGERVSHKIISLKEDGYNWIGKAMISSAPLGETVKRLIDDDIQFGTSTRGVGSIRESNGANYVQEDYHMATAGDIVFDPSAPDAFVNAMLEGKEWVWDNNVIIEAEIAGYKKIIKNTKNQQLEETALLIFQNFIGKL